MMKKVFSVLFSVIIVLSMTAVCYASETLFDVDEIRDLALSEIDDLGRLVDLADIINDANETALVSKLDEISEKYQFDLVIVSVDTLDDYDVEDYANAFYDTFGYGYGDTTDGMLLLLAMDTRDWTISKNGYGLTAFTDAGANYIMDKILPDLSDGNYTTAFTAYADLCDDFLAQAKAGNPYTADNLPKEPFNKGMSLIIALVVGLIGSLIITGSMKGQLKSVRFQTTASNYTKPGSLTVTESRDFFLYRTVSSREKKQDNDSNSGSRGGGSSRNVSGKF